MNELIVANVFFQAGAGTLLMLVGASSALRDIGSRRAVRMQELPRAAAGSVVELTPTRVARCALRDQAEVQSEAA